VCETRNEGNLGQVQGQELYANYIDPGRNDVGGRSRADRYTQRRSKIGMPKLDYSSAFTSKNGNGIGIILRCAYLSIPR